MRSLVKSVTMQLTQFTDYALRALIYIAIKDDVSTISGISAAYSISRNHVVKIIHRLAKEGVVKTTRGKNGGICLAMPAAEINLMELVCLLEPHLNIVECFNTEKANCRIIPVCKLKLVLNEAKQQFLNVLQGYTLADLIQNKEELKATLFD